MATTPEALAEGGGVCQPVCQHLGSPPVSCCLRKPMPPAAEREPPMPSKGRKERHFWLLLTPRVFCREIERY